MRWARPEQAFDATVVGRRFEAGELDAAGQPQALSSMGERAK